jgi:hypothetical protein
MQGSHARFLYFTRFTTVQALINKRSHQHLQKREEDFSSMTCEPDTAVRTNKDIFDPTTSVSGCNMDPRLKEEQSELLLGIGAQF